MWQTLLLRCVTLGLLTLNSALLFTAIFTDYWAIHPTVFGPLYEDLFKICGPVDCISIDRGNAYWSTVVLLLLAAVEEALEAVGVLLLFYYKENQKFHKYVIQGTYLPGLLVVITMSMYTGYFTSDIPIENRGWSFWMAWATFPLNTVAAIVAFIYWIFQEREFF